MENKLVLRDTMVRSKYIQRLCTPRLGFKNFIYEAGIGSGPISEIQLKLFDRIFSFDSMHSPEFNHAAIVAALQFIADQVAKKDGSIITSSFKDVYYICPKTYRNGVIKVVSTLLINEYPLKLKEYCGLRESLNPPKKPEVPSIADYFKQIAGWLELDNGFFFFTNKKMFEYTKYLYHID